MKHEYQDRLCLFLDVLGFSALVNKEECNVVHEIMSKIKDDLQSSKDYLDMTSDEPITTTFSDCIVLSIRVGDGKVESAANILVTATVKMLQETYLNQQIALRGGISYGKLYHQSDGVFGPAMNKAYELESKFADWPRVIFDRSVIKHFSNKNGLPSIGFKNYGDGFWGIDCLTRIEDVLKEETSYLQETGRGSEQVDLTCSNRFTHPVKGKFSKLERI